MAGTIDQAPRLHHEDLDVYRAAITFLAFAARVLESYPRGHASLADQLRRASLSIPLNIAEGYGKRGPNDRARFYDIARGSAHECGALLDASRVLRCPPLRGVWTAAASEHELGFELGVGLPCVQEAVPVIRTRRLVVVHDDERRIYDLHRHPLRHAHRVRTHMSHGARTEEENQ